VPFGGSAINIGPTKYCITTEILPYASSGPIITTVHDTAVFLAISFQLLRNSHAEGHGPVKSMRAFATGSYLPSFSRSVLQDGQAYYMVTVVANLLTSIMIYAPGLGAVYRSMFSVPSVMLTNVMACYVYRNTKLGLMRDPATLVTTSGLLTHVGQGNAERVTLKTSSGASGGSREVQWSKLGGVQIEMTKMTDNLTV